jgi:hypothetical protein
VKGAMIVVRCHGRKAAGQPTNFMLIRLQKPTDIVAIVDKLDAPDRIFVNLTLANSIESAGMSHKIACALYFLTQTDSQ